MGACAFPKGNHLRKPSEFRAVFDRGTKRHSRGFIFFHAANALGKTRLGISVGRKIGNAVVRNRMKRRMRESFRLHRQEWQLSGTDLVIVAKRGSERLSFQEMTREFAGAIFPRSGR